MPKSLLFPYVNRLLLQPLARLRRGMTLGIQGVVIDPEGRMLVVRQSYTSGWMFPGGGVERGETPIAALKREMVEETGVQLTGHLVMHGLFSNHANFPGDYVAVYIAKSFEMGPWRPTLEISDRAFLSADEIAADCSPAVQRRLDELAGTRDVSDVW